ncbi:putative membrane protein [Ruminiclostridium cellobioparum subsp. termitidis CT1112]|uniref:Putative membrane protein n=1 Tax=Ruminiclostridium cellobioparum subsp. termitidis CT1112 TaxID=1195236 RepID=S0FJ39_RUMCE|nr:putative membrane protein [Ruminiclostridium cellobioparum subsp. termitidis CT1112]
MQEVEKLFVYFTIYSFIGWFCEVVFCSFLSKRIVNRGFLAGPVCPVYGFGALFIIWLLEPVAFSLPFVFITGMAITSIIEYTTGWLLETFFGTRWWDYSNKRFNLQGRVCLENSICFGMMGVLLIEVIHPITEKLVGNIPYFYLMIIDILLFVVFIVDSIFTLNTLVNLNERLRKLYEFTEELRKNTDIQEWFNEREFLKSFEKLKIIIEEGKAGINQKIEIGRTNLNNKLEESKASLNQIIEESKTGFNHKFEESKLEFNKKLREKFEALTAKRGSGHRLIKAFPGMRSVRYNAQLGHLKEALKELKQKVTK